MLQEYQSIGRKLGVEEHKINAWWKSLNPKEREGMKKMAAVGLGGTGLAMAIAFNPEAMPLAFLPTSGYIQRERIKSALRKLHIIHEKDKLRKVV